MTESCFNNDNQQWAWDASSISIIQACPRKYYYKMVEGWSNPFPSVHLLFGAIYATALEHYFKHLSEGADKEEALRLIVREALIESHGRDFPHNTKTRENLIRTIVWYFEHFKEDAATTIELSDGKPAVELSFKMDVGNGILYCGHLDRFVELNGDPYVMDQKTTGATLSPYYFNQFNNSFQMSGYTFAGKSMFSIPVKGVIIDAAQIAVGFTRFDRGFTFRTESNLNEWYDELHYWIQFAHSFDPSGGEAAWPQNKSSCGNYGGCEFAEVCAKSHDVRPQFLAAKFCKGERWNPLEER